MVSGKIVFDARMINNSGIGRYIEKILVNTIDHFENITLLGNEQEIKEKLGRENLSIIDFRESFYSMSEQIRYPLVVPKCDLFWSPHFNVPLLPIKAKKRLATVHDVFHLAFYDMLTRPQKIYAKIVIKAALEKSDQVITVSHFSKEEILRFTSSKYENKIHVIHNGIDPLVEKNPHTKVPEYENYFLAVGNVKPHKNFRRTIEAYKIFLEKNIHNENCPHFLIVGKMDGLITGDSTAIDIVNQDKILKEYVHFLGRVSDSELSGIYKNALALIFPSYYEGFGFPPLEAMQLETPVLVSNSACMPEVCGDAAIYFDPYDINDIANKMGSMYKDIRLRDSIKIKGLDQVKKFDWGVAADQSIMIIKQLLDKQ